MMTSETSPDPDVHEARRAELAAEAVPEWDTLPAEDRERLLRVMDGLLRKQLPAPMVRAALRSTAGVLADLREEEERPDNAFRRPEVRAFMEHHAVREPASRAEPVREHKREERERLQAMAQRLIRQARISRGRHEVKKSRSLLMKLDQRELRRQLGREGEELCRQINTWLRSTAGGV
jgi:hypothetical protein